MPAGNSYASLLERYPEALQDCGPEVNMQIELSAKYAGYIERQHGEVAKLAHLENVRIPPDFDYAAVHGMRIEARQKLSKRPLIILGKPRASRGFRLGYFGAAYRTRKHQLTYRARAEKRRPH